MNRFWMLFCFFYFLSQCNADEIDEADRIDLEERSKETLFVSLGSYCAPAGYAKVSDFRKAAFPFDWNVSIDGEKLIELLEDDFLHFLDDDFLVPDDLIIPFASGTVLLNLYYHIEFVHEGVWRGPEYFAQLEALKVKYQRRIDRFRNLGQYSGKVYFMRAAYLHSETDKHRYFKSKENIEITPEYSLRLYLALKRRFPKLDLALIVINPTFESDIQEERRLRDDLIMIRAPIENDTLMRAAYKKFFLKLLQEMNPI